MGKFRDMLNEVKYSYDIQSKDNPYIGLDKSKLLRKKKSFETQIADLQNKVLRANLGSGGNKAGYFEEIESLQLKINQITYLLK